MFKNILKGPLKMLSMYLSFLDQQKLVMVFVTWKIITQHVDMMEVIALIQPILNLVMYYDTKKL